MTTLLYFFFDGFSAVAVAQTSTGFYRPGATTVADVLSRAAVPIADVLSRSVDVADTRRSGIDEQVI